MPTEKTKNAKSVIAQSIPVPVVASKGKKSTIKKKAPAKNGHVVNKKEEDRQPTTAGRSSSKEKKAIPKKVSVKKRVARKNITRAGLKKIIFQIRFHTNYGQDLFILGDHPLLGNGQVDNAVPMHYFDEEHWYVVIDLTGYPLTDADITYNYILKNPDGTINFDWGTDKIFNLAKTKAEEIVFFDAWNYAGYYENSFYTEPFAKVLLKNNHTEVKLDIPKKITHILKVKSPLLVKGQTLCILGSSDGLGNWNTGKPVLMSRNMDEDFYTVYLDLSKDDFPIAYKYCVYDVANKAFVRYEDGNNRVLHDAGKPKRQTVLNDGFAVLPNNTWKAAGIALPVFSLRSEKSFGIGEFKVFFKTGYVVSHVFGK